MYLTVSKAHIQRSYQQSPNFFASPGEELIWPLESRCCEIHTLMDHDPPDRGKAVLVGDAVHQLLPNPRSRWGALNLSRCGTRSHTPRSYGPKLFQNIRLAPWAVMQIVSNNFVRTPEKVGGVMGSIASDRYYLHTMPFGQAYRDFF
jgi:hypothetical protein